MLKPLTKKQLLTFHAVLAALDPNWSDIFSVYDVWRYTDKTEPTVRQHMKALADKGWIIDIQPTEWEARYVLSKEILLTKQS